MPTVAFLRYGVNARASAAAFYAAERRSSLRYGAFQPGFANLASRV
jgi:hypothetical protein